MRANEYWPKARKAFAGRSYLIEPDGSRDSEDADRRSYPTPTENLLATLLGSSRPNAAPTPRPPCTLSIWEPDWALMLLMSLFTSDMLYVAGEPYVVNHGRIFPDEPNDLAFAVG